MISNLLAVASVETVIMVLLSTITLDTKAVLLSLGCFAVLALDKLDEIIKKGVK
jgi:hypothetical protein